MVTNFSGHVIEAAHCALLASRGAYGILQNEELDVQEKVDYIATTNKQGEWLRHPFENQLTTRDLSLAKFETFCRTRDRDRVATSVYTVIPTVAQLDASVDGVELLIEELDVLDLSARTVHVLEIDRRGKRHVWTAQEFHGVLMERRARAVTKVCRVVAVTERRIVVCQSRSSRPIIVSIDEIAGRSLRIAFHNHLRRVSDLIGSSILVDVHPTSNHGINAKLRPSGPRLEKSKK